MPQPTPLHIATSSLSRLIKEEASYHSELSQQERSISRLEQQQQQQQGQEEGGIDDNHEFMLKQERRALEETKAVFPRLKERIERAVGDMEGLLESAGEGDPETVRARQVVGEAKAAMG